MELWTRAGTKKLMDDSNSSREELLLPSKRVSKTKAGELTREVTVDIAGGFRLINLFGSQERDQKLITW